MELKIHVINEHAIMCDIVGRLFTLLFIFCGTDIIIRAYELKITKP